MTGNGGAGVFNTDIVRLLQDTAGARDSMQRLMHQIAYSSLGREASFRCIPKNVDSMSSVRSEGALLEAHHVARASGRRSVDCADWTPELPHSIGLYQAFCRGYQKDTRVHKLFIGVNGGLNRCSDEFYNLMLDVGGEFTCKDISFSEEVWWLRKACQRARSSTAVLVADHFGLSIPRARDLFAFDQDLQVGVPVADTGEFDLKDGSDGDVVEFFSACVDTTAIQNGILSKMHEGEGIWVFKGNAKSSAKINSFGSLFGSKAVCCDFPTRSPFYRRGQGSASFVNGLDSDLVVRHASAPRTKPDGFVYQCFDERHFTNLSAMQ